jgi:hypothetical protein
MEVFCAFMTRWTRLMRDTLKAIAANDAKAVQHMQDQIFAGWCTNLLQELSVVRRALKGGVTPRPYYRELLATSKNNLSARGLEWREEGEGARTFLFHAVRQQKPLQSAVDGMDAAIEAHGDVSIALNTKEWKVVMRDGCQCSECQAIKLV